MNHKTENPDTFCEDPIPRLREDALEMVGKCIECGSCYIDCAFDNYGDDSEQCRKWIRESNDFILGKTSTISPALIEANLRCAECNRCYLSCPERIYRRHGNMLMKHMTSNPLRHRINIHPYSNWRVKQPAIEKFVLPKWEEAEQDWYGALNEFKDAEVLLYHGCYVYLQAAQCLKLEQMLEAAGVTFTTFGNLEYCCGTFGFYRGHSDMDTIKPRLTEMVKRVAPKRIITNCGHCYNAMSDLTVNIDERSRPTVRHPAEELLELNVAGRLEFAHIGNTYAIHDACNFRTLHDSHGPLRSFLRRIGGIHELMSNGVKGQCCGDVSKYFDPEHIEENNRKVKVREFISSGADNLLTVCAGCYEHFHTQPLLKSLDLIDVAYEAFAIARAEDAAKAEAPQIRWENMAPIMEEE